MKTIGILGAGQLGKMLAEAATKLGFETHVYAPDEDPIAAPVATRFTQGSYDDAAALEKFAESVDIITLEFENVPVGPLKNLKTPICPGVQVLEVSQHRIHEKELARSLGMVTAPFATVTSQAELQAALQTIDMPGILKTCRMGYDGKGQWKITEGQPLPAIDFSTPQDLIYEGFVNFEREISVIVARNMDGDVECFEPVENVHQHHILHTTTAPANLSSDVARLAMAVAMQLAAALHVVGVLAVEMFVTADGNVLVNEVAPRPHNSGHWTMDGCNVSQFEQAIRAITGMPLIKPQRTASNVVMTNLIGEEVNDLAKWSGAHIHLYGKKEIRPGRKMGHVTICS